MRHTRRHRLSAAGIAALLAIGLLVGSGPQHAAAEVSVNATCEGNTYPSTTINLNSWTSVSFGLTGRVCTDGKMVWNWSSSYPSNCWVTHSPILIVSGVCGYAGNFTSSFSYIEKVTMKNLSGTAIIVAGTLLGLPPFIFPYGYEFPCTVKFTYTPYYVLHGWSGSATGSCGPMTYLW